MHDGLEARLKEKLGGKLEETLVAKIAEFGGLLTRRAAVLLICRQNGIDTESEVRLSDAARQELLPFVDMAGLNDTELAAFGVELEDLAEEAQALLFHSPQQQKVLPESKLNAAALEFARRCAAYKARTGECATERDAAGASSDFVEMPNGTVGLGDAFSCAYFMCLR